MTCINNPPVNQLIKNIQTTIFIIRRKQNPTLMPGSDDESSSEKVLQTIN